MKRELLAWLLFIVCFIALSYLACESAASPEHYKYTIAGKQLNKCVYDMTSESRGKRSERTMVERMHEGHPKRFQRAGKGVYGGGTVLRPRSRNKNGANSLLLTSCSFASMTLGYGVAGFLLFVCLLR